MLGVNLEAGASRQGGIREDRVDPEIFGQRHRPERAETCVADAIDVIDRQSTVRQSLADHGHLELTAPHRKRACR